MELSEGLGLAAGLLDAGVSIGTNVANLLPTERKCTVHIKNKSSTYALCNPSVRTESGRCFIPFPPTIEPSGEGEAVFAKLPSTAQGSVGVFALDLVNKSTQRAEEKMAIMYKVPFDLKRKSVEYALGVFKSDAKCDHGLFRQMSKATDAAFIRGKAKGPSLTYKGVSITISATMSDCFTSYMKVQVTDN